MQVFQFNQKFGLSHTQVLTGGALYMSKNFELDFQPNLCDFGLEKKILQNCQKNEQLLYFQQPSRAAQKNFYLMIVDNFFCAFFPVVYVSQPSAFWPMSDWSLWSWGTCGPTSSPENDFTYYSTVYLIRILLHNVFSKYEFNFFFSTDTTNTQHT